jgi:hypothetical protein
LHELRSVDAAGPGGRESGVANCGTPLEHFRSWPHAAPVAGFRNIRIGGHLRPERRPTDAAQSCPNWSKALRELEIRRDEKKNADPAFPQAAFH